MIKEIESFREGVVRTLIVAGSKAIWEWECLVGNKFWTECKVAKVSPVMCASMLL